MAAALHEKEQALVDQSTNITKQQVLDWIEAKAETDLPPTREICHDCKQVSPVGFVVPDWIWEKAVGDEQVLCIKCFAHRADDAYLPWDEEINFHPVSKRTHREQEQRR